MAGMTIGAIAMLALTGSALTEEESESKKDEVFKVKAVIGVPGVSAFFSFDISWFDPVLNKYFLADRNNNTIDVVDPTTFEITQFPPPGFAGVNPKGNDFSGPDGVLTANNHTEVWVGDSPGKLWVLDSITGAVKTLPAGATNPILVKTNPDGTNASTTRADELCYDPKDNLIMIASPGEEPPFVTFISTKTYKVVSQLLFDGGTPVMGLKATNGLEQCEWDSKTRKFYQNVPEVNGPGDDTAPGAVAVIDPKTMKVENSFSVDINACAGPQGMAIGPDDQILLGCNAKSPDGHRNTAVISKSTGDVLKVFPDLGGADAVTFNPGDLHYIIPSCNTPCRTVPTPGAITGPQVLGIVDAKQLRLDRTVTTAEQNSDTIVTSGNPRTIHSVAANQNAEEKQIFLPIPAVGGNAPQFDPTLCDSFDDAITRIGSPNTATGCIVILAAKPDRDDRSRVAQERGNDDRQE
jgi:hypothetical protein